MPTAADNPIAIAHAAEWVTVRLLCPLCKARADVEPSRSGGRPGWRATDASCRECGWHAESTWPEGEPMRATEPEAEDMARPPLGKWGQDTSELGRKAFKAQGGAHCQCAVPSCQRRASEGGFCEAHWSAYRAAGKPADREAWAVEQSRRAGKPSSRKPPEAVTRSPPADMLEPAPDPQPAPPEEPAMARTASIKTAPDTCPVHPDEPIAANGIACKRCAQGAGRRKMPIEDYVAQRLKPATTRSGKKRNTKRRTSRTKVRPASSAGNGEAASSDEIAPGLVAVRFARPIGRMLIHRAADGAVRLIDIDGNELFVVTLDGAKA